MSSLRSLLVAMIIAAGFTGENASAQESEHLQQLNRQLIDACPMQWESMPKYLLHSNDHDEARLIYTQAMKDQGVDIWQGDSADRQNYIKFALRHLIDDSGAPLESFTHPVNITYQCWSRRNEYLLQLIQEVDATTVSFKDRFNEFRDDDNDGIFNSSDLCGTTQEPPANTGSVTAVSGYDVYASNGLLAVDQQGCAAWERDQDQDSVPDYFDHCPAELGAVTTVDGCADADSDGVSNGKDSYPYQDDTICVAE